MTRTSHKYAADGSKERHGESGRCVPIDDLFFTWHFTSDDAWTEMEASHFAGFAINFKGHGVAVYIENETSGATAIFEGWNSIEVVIEGIVDWVLRLDGSVYVQMESARSYISRQQGYSERENAKTVDEFFEEVVDG